jgi:hypothetical protein
MTMPERRFAILKYSGKTPSLATCELCHLKFFTPSELKNNIVEAEMYLREKFEWHECKDWPQDEIAPGRFNRDAAHTVRWHLRAGSDP